MIPIKFSNLVGKILLLTNLFLHNSHIQGVWKPIENPVDLSNEELCTIVGSEVAKISEIKVGGQKKIINSAKFETGTYFI